MAATQETHPSIRPLLSRGPTPGNQSLSSGKENKAKEQKLSGAPPATAVAPKGRGFGDAGKVTVRQRRQLPSEEHVQKEQFQITESQSSLHQIPLSSQDILSYTSTSQSIEIRHSGRHHKSHHHSDRKLHHESPSNDNLLPTKKAVDNPREPVAASTTASRLNPLQTLGQKMPHQVTNSSRSNSPSAGTVIYEPKYVYKFQFECSPPDWVGLWDGKARKFCAPPTSTILHVIQAGKAKARLDPKRVVSLVTQRMSLAKDTPIDSLDGDSTKDAKHSIRPPPPQSKPPSVPEQPLPSPEEYLIILRQTIDLKQYHHWQVSLFNIPF